MSFVTPTPTQVEDPVPSAIFLLGGLEINGIDSTVDVMSRSA